MCTAESALISNRSIYIFDGQELCKSTTLVSFAQKSKHVDNIGSSYIPEYLFKGITITIVLGSMITAILIPNGMVFLFFN